MNCEYCEKEGIQRIENAAVCDQCWKLLQNPSTALPLIRGHLTLQLRGTMPETVLKKSIDIFMREISKWQRLN